MIRRKYVSSIAVLCFFAFTFAVLFSLYLVLACCRMLPLLCSVVSLHLLISYPLFATLRISNMFIRVVLAMHVHYSELSTMKDPVGWKCQQRCNLKVQELS